MIFIVIFIGFSWLIVDQFNTKKSRIPRIGEPTWMDLVDEFKSTALLINTKDQLDEYLEGIHEQFRNFETDYSFLVAFNSIKREVQERLK